MTQDEIRKLLGGYATDALSADERRILFEAALEDQELFNALQNEDALRELLDDPVSRDQVRRALAGPIASKPRPHFWSRPSFWSRRWLLGVAVPAVAAVIVIVIMNRANAPRLIAPPVEVASDQLASSQVAAAPRPAPLAMKLEPKEKVKAKTLAQVARATPAAAPQSGSTGADGPTGSRSPRHGQLPRRGTRADSRSGPAAVLRGISCQCSALSGAAGTVFSGPQRCGWGRHPR